MIIGRKWLLREGRRPQCSSWYIDDEGMYRCKRKGFFYTGMGKTYVCRGCWPLFLESHEAHTQIQQGDV